MATTAPEWTFTLFFNPSLSHMCFTHVQPISPTTVIWFCLVFMWAQHIYNISNTITLVFWNVKRWQNYHLKNPCSLAKYSMGNPTRNMNVLSKGPFTIENILARFTFKIHLLPGLKYAFKFLYVGMLVFSFFHSMQNSWQISRANVCKHIIRKSADIWWSFFLTFHVELLI